jgi:hypothetical protein
MAMKNFYLKSIFENLDNLNFWRLGLDSKFLLVRFYSSRVVKSNGFYNFVWGFTIGTGSLVYFLENLIRFIM